MPYYHGNPYYGHAGQLHSPTAGTSSVGWKTKLAGLAVFGVAGAFVCIVILGSAVCVSAQKTTKATSSDTASRSFRGASLDARGRGAAPQRGRITRNGGRDAPPLSTATPFRAPVAAVPPHPAAEIPQCSQEHVEVSERSLRVARQTRAAEIKCLEIRDRDREEQAKHEAFRALKDEKDLEDATKAEKIAKSAKGAADARAKVATQRAQTMSHIAKKAADAAEEYSKSKIAAAKEAIRVITSADATRSAAVIFGPAKLFNFWDGGLKTVAGWREMTADKKFKMDPERILLFRVQGIKKTECRRSKWNKEYVELIAPVHAVSTGCSSLFRTVASYVDPRSKYFWIELAESAFAGVTVVAQGEKDPRETPKAFVERLKREHKIVASQAETAFKARLEDTEAGPDDALDVAGPDDDSVPPLPMEPPSGSHGAPMQGRSMPMGPSGDEDTVETTDNRDSQRSSRVPVLSATSGLQGSGEESGDPLRTLNEILRAARTPSDAEVFLRASYRDGTRTDAAGVPNGTPGGVGSTDLDVGVLDERVRSLSPPTSKTTTDHDGPSQGEPVAAPAASQGAPAGALHQPPQPPADCDPQGFHFEEFLAPLPPPSSSGVHVHLGGVTTPAAEAMVDVAASVEPASSGVARGSSDSSQANRRGGGRDAPVSDPPSSSVPPPRLGQPPCATITAPLPLSETQEFFQNLLLQRQRSAW